MEKRKESHSEDDLISASICVGYELGRMGNTLGLLLESNVTTTSTPREQVVFNALLDSFLQATRNLYHFLCSYKPRASDIIAENFFDDTELGNSKLIV